MDSSSASNGNKRGLNGFIALAIEHNNHRESSTNQEQANQMQHRASRPATTPASAEGQSTRREATSTLRKQQASDCSKPSRLQLHSSSPHSNASVMRPNPGLHQQQQQQQQQTRSGLAKETPDDEDEDENSDAAKFKTELCRNWATNFSCPYGKHCTYAHGESELRSRKRIETYKTQPCTDPARSGGNECPYGIRCNYAHPGEAMRAPFRVPYMDHEYHAAMKSAFPNHDMPFGVFV